MSPAPQPTGLWPRLGRWLSRETSGQAFIPEIDGLRFIAVMAVVLYHIAGYAQKKLTIPNAYQAAEDSILWQVLHLGSFGVPMFFVISGFIVAIPFLRHSLQGERKPSLGKYFLRRVTRLEPPYVISMVISAILLIVVAGKPARDMIEHALVSIVYLHATVYGRESIVNVVAWSLEIEVQFYLLMPLLALVGWVRPALARRAVLVAAFAAACVLAYVTRRDGQRITGLFVWNFGQYFILGILLCDLYLTRWRIKPATVPLLADAAACVSGAALVFVLLEGRYIELIAPPLLAVFIAGALRGAVISWFLRRRPIYTIGGMCYTIYLYNFIVISALGRFTTRLTLGHDFLPNLLLQCALLSAAVVLVCAALFALTERPFMERDWPARLWAWIRPAHATR